VAKWLDETDPDGWGCCPTIRSIVYLVIVCFFQEFEGFRQYKVPVPGLCGPSYPDLTVDPFVIDWKGPELCNNGSARILDVLGIEIRVFRVPDTDKTDAALFAYDEMEREHAQRLKREYHEILRPCPFLRLGNCLHGGQFPGHGGSPPVVPGIGVSCL